MIKPSITIDLLEYLQDDLLVYNHYDVQAVSQGRGAQIKSLDPNEQYVYVEFTTNEKGKEIALVWDIKRWKASEELNLRRKAASDRARQQYYLDDANIAIVSKELARVTGITHAELLKPLAMEIIKNRKFDSLPCLNLSELKVRVD